MNPCSMHTWGQLSTGVLFRQERLWSPQTTRKNRPQGRWLSVRGKNDDTFRLACNDMRQKNESPSHAGLGLSS